MFRKVKGSIGSLFNRKLAKETDGSVASEVNNISEKASQTKLLIGLLLVVVVCLGTVVLIIQEKAAVNKPVEKPAELKVETADKALDAEGFWRNHQENELKAVTDELTTRLNQYGAATEEAKKKITGEMRSEMDLLAEQLKAARQELADAGVTLREVAGREQERIDSAPRHEASTLEMQEFGEDIELDVPKSAADYVPKGTFFTGYLQGGLVVSTALNTKDENPISVTIVLTGRGNLAAENKTDIRECSIQGRAYGDLSSERAVIRLETMTCKKDGAYTTSDIAGEVYGPDGLNNIKGRVVSTSSKHIKNAMIGGVISGLSSSAKGQDGFALTSAGAVSTKNKGFKDVLGAGALTGVSNAGEKIADHFLREAEALSPVLEIPAGVWVNPKITEGFFMGEIGTHRKIKEKRGKRIEKAQVDAGLGKQNSGGSDGSW